MKRFISQGLFNINIRIKANHMRLFSFKISSDPNDSVKNKYKQLNINIDKDNLSFNDLIENDSYSNIRPVEQSLVNKEIFLSEASKYLNKLQDAFNNIDDNSITITEIGPTLLTIKAGKIGLYIFKVEDEGVISMTSPVSGFFKYKFNPSINFWVNVKDEHILDDLLIREFCKHSKGLLTIE